VSIGAIVGVGRVAILLAAGVAAGIANGIAGGGSFFSFPVLLALGYPALTANVSSSVGILPSYLPGVQGFRAELRAKRAELVSLIPACIVGALAGTALLLTGSSAQFRAVVPWLIGVATLAFAIQPLVVRFLATPAGHHGAHRIARQVGTFAIAVYGGYFGAGLGIMLLALFGLTLPDDLGTLSGLRSALSLVINASAVVVFLIRGHLAWEVVFCLWIGTFVGGILGTGVVKRVSPSILRAIIVVIGVVTTIRLAV
jgi:uncharacterized membrane protein YfcA